MTYEHFTNRVLLVSLLGLAGTLPAARAQENPAEPSPERITVAPPVAVPHTEPLTLSRRYKWAASTSVSPSRLAGYAVSSAWSTMTNSPDEYGPHWEGYGKRMGMRLATGATGIMMEASVGALWNEDPRYVRATGQPLKNRLSNVVKMTFMARNRDGQTMPAYARYISVPANSFMSNAWRADSEADTRHALVRIPMSFLSRAIGNAFTEFWPDAAKLLHRDRD